MLSREEIESNSEVLTPSAKAAWLSAWKGSVIYQTRPYAFTDVQAKLDAATPVQNQMLNALLTQLEEIGSGEASLVPGSSRGGVQYSQRLERDALIAEAFGVLYDVAAITVFYGTNRVATAVQRPTYSVCPRCGYGEVVDLCGACGYRPWLWY